MGRENDRAAVEFALPIPNRNGTLQMTAGARHGDAWVIDESDAGSACAGVAGTTGANIPSVSMSMTAALDGIRTFGTMRFIGLVSPLFG